MLVKSVKGEIVNISVLEEFTFSDHTLIAKKDGRAKVYTLVEESKKELEKYLENEKVK